MANKIPTIKYKDWFINQKYIPVETDPEFLDFWSRQKELCLHGFYMDGVFFPGTLYWHLNFWKTEIDYVDDYGKIQQKYTNPEFRDNEWLIFNAIDQAEKEHKGLCIFGSRRIGKALLNSSKIYLENGVKEIGDAKIGDRIYGRDGKLTTITGVFPQGVRPVYKMVLQDGRELFSDENHLWVVVEKACKSKRINGKRTYKHYEREVVYTTRQLLEKGVRRDRLHNGYKDGETHNIQETKFWIPNNDPIEYPERELPIEPYFLGLWLSDGTSMNTGITSADQEIVDYIYDHAKRLGLFVNKNIKRGKENKASTYITQGLNRETKKRTENILRTALDSLNLIKNKHIPDIYKYSSYRQRLELLRGMMDGDGWCSSQGGSLGYCCTDLKLSKDFYDLCRSMGMGISKKEHTARLYDKDCGPCWRFNIFTEEKIFKLTRKLELMRFGVKGKQPKINKTGIISIEYAYDAETTCIMVDNESKTFLTDSYTTTHNSVFEASYIGYGATFDKDSQNVIAGLNAPDIKLITDKVDKGLNNLPGPWIWTRVENDWKKQVTLGIKKKDGLSIPFSSILIRNLDDGNNEEAIAGTKPRRLIIDEFAKGSGLKSLQAAIPGLTTAMGWGCSPIITATGGSVQKFADAKELYFSPEAYNFLAFEDADDPNQKHGLFLGAKYRMEAKEVTSLAKYLGIEGKELSKVKISVSNEEKAFKITDDTLELRKKSNDSMAYLKEKMYYPKKASDIFLNSQASIYNVELCKAQIERIQTNQIRPSCIELYQDIDGKIRHKKSEKLPISNFPIKPTDSKDAPICVWEFPVENPPFGLYAAGLDSYRQGDAKYSKSLGSVYIFKRINSLNGSFKNMFVASYVARPESKATWDEQARFLIKYYNALALVENDEISFIQYMLDKNEGHLLADTPAFQKEISPNSKVSSRKKGISRASSSIREYLNTCYKKYMEEQVSILTDINGNPSRALLGINGIYDRLLLEETMQYYDGLNTDRIIGAQLAIAQAMSMDPIIGNISGEADDILKAYFSRNDSKKGGKLFTAGSLFGRKRSRGIFR